MLSVHFHSCCWQAFIINMYKLVWLFCICWRWVDNLPFFLSSVVHLEVVQMVFLAWHCHCLTSKCTVPVKLNNSHVLFSTLFYFHIHVLFSPRSNFKSGHYASIVLTGKNTDGVNSHSSYAFCPSLTVRAETPAVEKHTELCTWLWTQHEWNVWGLNSKGCEGCINQWLVTWNTYEMDHSAAHCSVHHFTVNRKYNISRRS